MFLFFGQLQQFLTHVLQTHLLAFQLFCLFCIQTLLFGFQMPSLAFQALDRRTDVHLTVSGILQIGHVISQFSCQTFVRRCRLLIKKHGIAKSILIHAFHQNLKIALFYGQYFTVCLAYQADALFLAVKIPLQTKDFAAALKSHDTCKLSCMKPRFPDAVFIFSGCPPSLLFNPEKHTEDK